MKLSIDIIKSDNMSAQHSLNILLMAAQLVCGDDPEKGSNCSVAVPNPKSGLSTNRPPPKTLRTTKAPARHRGRRSHRSKASIATSFHADSPAKKVGETDWTTFWTGEETSTTDKPAEPGVYDCRARALAGEDLGAWCSAIEVDLTE